MNSFSGSNFSIIRLLLSQVLMLGLLSSCIMTGLSNVDADPDFNWNALKRDQILMTPLQDLRESPTAPEGYANKLNFFSDAERLAYPEKFKQVFFKLRKDIRVFGAGGAFESVANNGTLKDVARNVINKTPVPEATWKTLIAGSQDIRFVFFFAVTGEHLAYDYSYSPPDKSRDYAVKTYSATRRVTAKLALWDSQKNKTVWIGTQIMSPTSTHTVDIKRAKKGLSFLDMTLDSWDSSGGSSDLATELRVHRKRFPEFRDREPEFSGSFDDFALGLPINPSEENLIEYSYFTYHRPELGLRWARIGKSNAPTLHLGSSSILYNRYRVGGAILLPLANPEIKFKDEKYSIAYMHFGPTFDIEWTLNSSTRLLTGVMLGASTFTIKKIDDAEQQQQSGGSSSSSSSSNETVESKSETDAAWFAWPRAMVLFGERKGFVWGVGGTWRAYDTIEEPILKANRPSNWGVDASIGYTIRGF